MPGDDKVLYVVSVDPLRYEHLHDGTCVALDQQNVGAEAGVRGRRRLREHTCPRCGDQLMESQPEDELAEDKLL